MDKQNGISSADRPKVIKELRHIVHAESQESLEEAYENFVSGELGEKYNNLLLYFDQFVWKNKECWAKFYRINFLSYKFTSQRQPYTKLCGGSI